MIHVMNSLRVNDWGAISAVEMAAGVNWMQDLCRINTADNLTSALPVWIKEKVIPAYTVASVSYFQSLPGLLSTHLWLLWLIEYLQAAQFWQANAKILNKCTHFIFF